MGRARQAVAYGMSALSIGLTSCGSAEQPLETVALMEQVPVAPVSIEEFRLVYNPSVTFDEAGNIAEITAQVITGPVEWGDISWSSITGKLRITCKEGYLEKTSLTSDKFEGQSVPIVNDLDSLVHNAGLRDIISSIHACTNQNQLEP